MPLIPVNIQFRVSTKFRQINSPTRIQRPLTAPTGKGNRQGLAAQGKGKCATGKLAGVAPGTGRDTSRSRGLAAAGQDSNFCLLLGSEQRCEARGWLWGILLDVIPTIAREMKGFWCRS